MYKKIIIIGAGAAGIGMGITLKELGIEDYVILEKEDVGNSFDHWPKETRFITPSFTSNGFGMPDLNAVSVATSPSYTLEKERLSGPDYAKYLQIAAQEYQLPILPNTEVENISKEDNHYVLETTIGKMIAEYVIFALGEYSFPNKKSIEGGSEYGIHYGEVDTWSEIEGEKQTIIGGNESAIDAALNLVQLGKKVSIYTRNTGLLADEADPSKRLSPYTRQKFFALKENESLSENIRIYNDISIKSIIKDQRGYQLLTTDGETIYSENNPILCTGFTNGAKILAKGLFSYRNSGEAILNSFDESVISPNCFLIGPSVRNGSAIFCYIYKFRQRFAFIAKEIAQRNQLILKQETLEYYKEQAFYLEDCEKCEVNCSC